MTVHRGLSDYRPHSWKAQRQRIEYYLWHFHYTELDIINVSIEVAPKPSGLEWHPTHRLFVYYGGCGGSDTQGRVWLFTGKELNARTRCIRIGWLRSQLTLIHMSQAKLPHRLDTADCTVWVFGPLVMDWVDTANKNSANFGATGLLTLETTRLRIQRLWRLNYRQSRWIFPPCS